MRTIALLSALLFSFSVHAADTPSPRMCEANFAVEGSFFSGKSYKTWNEFSGISYDTAFRKTAQAAASGGWGTVTPNKDAGIITASQTVTMGQGATAPLSIVVQEKKGGVVRVEAIFSTSGGQMASADTAKTELCKLVEAAGE